MDVYFQSEIGICQEFMLHAGAKKEAVSIVISPLKVIGSEMDLRVVNGCNMWTGCFNASCFYSRAGRQKPKIEPAQR